MPHICLPGTTLWAVPRFRRNTKSASITSVASLQVNEAPPEQTALEALKYEKRLRPSKRTSTRDI